MEGVGPGSAGGPNLVGGYYVYPYYVSVNNSSAWTPMLCDTFSNDVSNGQSWSAYVSTYSNLSNTMFKTAALYQEAAWLFHQLGTDPSASTAGAVNYAIWGLFEPTSGVESTSEWQSSAVQNLLTAYSTASNQSAYDNSIVIYTPVGSSQGTGPQEFIAAATTPVPEPGTLALMGSGLITGLGFIRRKRLL
jgi:hypothetical protein